MNPYHTLPDLELIRQYRLGDEQAFETLLTRHRQRVFTAIVVFVRDRYLAEDIFQETFIRVVNELRNGKYNDEGKFIGWVLRIANNLCIDYYRASKLKPRITTPDGKDIFSVLPIADSSPNGEKQMIRSERIQTIREMINRLPEDQKEVLIMRHYMNLSFKEIAKITGNNLNTCLGRMRYALKNLARMKEATTLAD